MITLGKYFNKPALTPSYMDKYKFGSRLTNSDHIFKQL